MPTDSTAPFTSSDVTPAADPLRYIEADEPSPQATMRVRKRNGSTEPVAPSCSLVHVPIDLAVECTIDGELKSWLAFGAQKLEELRALADAAEAERPLSPRFAEARYVLANRGASTRTPIQRCGTAWPR